MTCPRPSSSKQSFLSLCLLCCLALWPHPGAAAPDVVFGHKIISPAAWTVAPITRDDDDTRKFCSSKTGYETALSFVFARDSTGGQSLALEFPDKAFSAGATVPVLLAPGETQYGLNALAATTRILLIGLPRHGEIERGLLQERQLVVQVGQQRYFLSLSGFAASVAKVDECIVALGQGENFEPLRMRVEADSEQMRTVMPAIKREVMRVRNVSDAEARSFNPAVAAHGAVLEDEIQRLRAENRKLMVEKQQAERELLALTDGMGVPVAVPSAVVPEITRSDKQLPWSQAQSFDDVVAAYMLTEAARCVADFAQMQGARYTTADDQPVQEVEIACVGLPAQATGLPADYAAAVLFVGGQGQVTAIVHQGPAGMIEQALAARATVLQAKR